MALVAVVVALVGVVGVGGGVLGKALASLVSFLEGVVLVFVLVEEGRVCLVEEEEEEIGGVVVCLAGEGDGVLGG